MNNLIIHVPHSSMYIPEEYKRTALIAQEELELETGFMCDTGVLELIPPALKDNAIIFPYSRLYCDVERFRDESEAMNRYGMGYIYTHDSMGREMFRPGKEHSVQIDKIYEEHHRMLDSRADAIVSEYGSCIIIDLHSYSDEMVRRIFGYTGCPDVCIGVEPDYYSKDLTDGLKKICRGLGLRCMINYPYSGSMIPNRFYGKKDTGIVSVMLEINKRVLDRWHHGNG